MPTRPDVYPKEELCPSSFLLLAKMRDRTLRLTIVVFGSHELEKIALAEDADWLPFRYQHFRFEMLAALRLTSRETGYILIAYDEQRRSLRDAAIYFASGTGCYVGCFASRHR